MADETLAAFDNVWHQLLELLRVGGGKLWMEAPRYRETLLIYIQFPEFQFNMVQYNAMQFEEVQFRRVQ